MNRIAVSICFVALAVVYHAETVIARHQSEILHNTGGIDVAWAVGIGFGMLITVTCITWEFGSALRKGSVALYQSTRALVLQEMRK